MLHWSKSRHEDYKNCPRRFFYANVAASKNSSLAALRDSTSPALARHEAVRRVIAEVVKAPDWTPEDLPATVSETAKALRGVIGDEFECGAQMSIVEACLQSFGADVLPRIREAKVLYVSDGNPQEFVYDGLSMMALPELVIEADQSVEIITWKTGLSQFSDEVGFLLRSHGLVGWCRSILGQAQENVTVSEVFLREDGYTASQTPSDEEVRQWVAEAKATATEYSASAKIKDFPALPGLDNCRFCRFSDVCPEWQAFSESNYDLKALSGQLAKQFEDPEQARQDAEGEERDVFLCHSSEDKEEYVRPLARIMEARGVSFWLDEAELEWGDPLLKTINRGLATSRYVMCFLTPSFLERGWPQAEMGGVMSAQLSDGGKRILPLQIAPLEEIRTEYPMLGGLKMETWDSGLEEIVKSLRRVLASE